jgi:hypothetical protein
MRIQRHNNTHYFVKSFFFALLRTHRSLLSHLHSTFQQNMSRYFSTAARAAKDMVWSLKGTTADVSKDLVAIERAVSTNVELSNRVNKGVID